MLYVLWCMLYDVSRDCYVVCCMLCVAWYALYVVCLWCTLYDVSRCLNVVCCMLHSLWCICVCCVFYGVCYMMYPMACTLYVVCCMLHGLRCMRMLFDVSHGL